MHTEYLIGLVMHELRDNIKQATNASQSVLVTEKPWIIRTYEYIYNIRDESNIYIEPIRMPAVC